MKIGTLFINCDVTTATWFYLIKYLPKIDGDFAGEVYKS
jgi:hypothetical protein